MALPELLQQSLCIALEKLFNRALALNTGELSALASLNEKSLTLELAELVLPITITVCQQNIMVSTLTSLSSCTIQTNLTSLIALKDEQQLTKLIKTEQLDISGEIKVAQQFIKLAEQLHIDWQTELAKHIGDIATHKLVTSAKPIANKLAFSQQQLSSDIGEWLVHEQALLVTAPELNQFYDGVQATCSQCDSLAARINALAANLTAKIRQES